MESQCLGLAEALGLEPVVKRIVLRAPWRLLSPYLRLGLGWAFDDSAHALAPPWPDLLIASGRQSVPASLHVREQSQRAGKRTFTIQIQNPVIDAGNFDLVVAPMHDELTGLNVVSTIGALHRVTKERLAGEAASVSPRVAQLPRPYIGVMIGGANASYRLGAREMETMAERLCTLAARMKASLLITPSRRTGEENVSTLRSALSDVPAFLWNGGGDNPYYGILGLSDCLIVTADSVNMISEACASGRPVYIYDLPGGSPKSSRFLRTIEERGLARKFEIPLVPYSAQPLDEMAAVVAEVERRTKKVHHGGTENTELREAP
jgi:mitochondrial fission protein ELM1